MGRPLASESKTPWAGLLLAAGGAIGFSGKAIIIKLAYRHGVDPTTLIMLRMLFALPVFLVMAWWAGRGKPPLSGREWAGVVGLGFTGYYLSSYLDFIGLQYISASLERLILYLNPTLVLLLGWLLYRKRIGLMHAVGMAVSYSGVVLVFGHEISVQGSMAGWGALLVLASTVSYAFYMVYSAEMVQKLGSLRLVGLASAVACILCIAQYVVLAPAGTLATVKPEVVWLSALNASACTVAPILMVMMAIERIGAGLASQTGMIGPLMTILMGVWLLDEPFTGWVAAGSVLVVAGIYVVTRANRVRA